MDTFQNPKNICLPLLRITSLDGILRPAADVFFLYLKLHLYAKLGQLTASLLNCSEYFRSAAPGDELYKNSTHGSYRYTTRQHKTHLDQKFYGAFRFDILTYKSERFQCHW